MAKTFVSKRGRYVACAFALLCYVLACAMTYAAETSPVRIEGRGKLVYDRDEFGNRIPDFSHCGYAGADQTFPTCQPASVVKPGDGDDGHRIQAAIDSVAKLPIGADGFRGAVQLAPVNLKSTASFASRTPGLFFAGPVPRKEARRLRQPAWTAGRSCGSKALTTVDLAASAQYRVLDEKFPVGESKLRLDSAAGLKVGDHIMVTRPSTRSGSRPLVRTRSV